MDTAFEDQLHAATAEADRIVHAASGQTPRPAITAAWTTNLLDQLADNLLGQDTDGPATCQHLRDTPIQPTYTYSWEPHLRCLTCHTSHQAERDPTNCDRCHDHSAGLQLHITLLRVRHLTVIAAICQPCEAHRHHPTAPPETRT
jgi:hypothetical protein